jgi:hypothetical protein
LAQSAQGESPYAACQNSDQNGGENGHGGAP